MDLKIYKAAMGPEDLRLRSPVLIRLCRSRTPGLFESIGA